MRRSRHCVAHCATVDLRRGTCFPGPPENFIRGSFSCALSSASASQPSPQCRSPRRSGADHLADRRIRSSQQSAPDRPAQRRYPVERLLLRPSVPVQERLRQQPRQRPRPHRCGRALRRSRQRCCRRVGRAAHKDGHGIDEYTEYCIQLVVGKTSWTESVDYSWMGSWSARRGQPPHSTDGHLRPAVPPRSPTPPTAPLGAKWARGAMSGSSGPPIPLKRRPSSTAGP